MSKSDVTFLTCAPTLSSAGLACDKLEVRDRFYLAGSISPAVHTVSQRPRTLFGWLPLSLSIMRSGRDICVLCRCRVAF